MPEAETLDPDLDNRITRKLFAAVSEIKIPFHALASFQWQPITQCDVEVYRTYRIGQTTTVFLSQATSTLKKKKKMTPGFENQTAALFPVYNFENWPPKWSKKSL